MIHVYYGCSQPRELWFIHVHVHVSIRASFRTLFRSGHKREYQSKGGGGSRGMLPQGKI